MVLLVAKCFLRSVDHVEEAILILLTLEQLSHGHWDAGHWALIDKQEECLIRIQLHAASEYQTEIINYKLQLYQPTQKFLQNKLQK